MEETIKLLLTELKEIEVISTNIENTKVVMNQLVSDLEFKKAIHHSHLKQFLTNTKINIHS